MSPTELKRYHRLYELHLTNLTLQGKRPATIDAYSRAVRRISEFFDRCPDTLSTTDLKSFFASLISTHPWSTVKLDRNGLHFFYRHTLNKQWVVDCQSVGYGQPALEYLSRYLYRGVLPDNDIIHSDDHNVTFRYKESKTNAIKTRSLPTLEFLLLILQHVLPKGLQRVRDYGFLRGQARALRVRIQLLMLGIFYQTPPSIIPIRAKAIRTCPHCQNDMECVGITRPR
ncbi:transposase [Aliivibrio sp. EL58]|uniref:transposase n=1 Tax=Aliivibrio sp. EL58 TaxID=2107582 RepID=UPI000EFC8679|nr:transposase [Aliivibrio sp. EL58]